LRRIFIFCFFVVIGSCIPVIASQQEKLVIDDSFRETKIGHYVDYMEDLEGVLSIEELLKETHPWEKLGKESVSLGFTDSVYWFRFVLDDRRTSGDALYVEVGGPVLDSVKLFTENSDGEIIVAETGDSLPFASRDVNDRNFIFKIDSKKNSGLYILRIESSSSYRFPLKVLSGAAMIERNNYQYPIYWFYYGLMFVIVIHNLFIFFTVREPVYLTFSLFTGVWLFYELAHNGFGYQFLWPENPWFQGKSIPFFAAVLIFLIGSFFRLYLEAEKYPIFNRLLLYLIIIPGAMLTILSLLVGYGISMKADLFVGLLSAPLLFIFTLYCVFKGQRNAVFILLGFIGLLFGPVSYSH